MSDRYYLYSYRCIGESSVQARAARGILWYHRTILCFNDMRAARIAGLAPVIQQNWIRRRGSWQETELARILFQVSNPLASSSPAWESSVRLWREREENEGTPVSAMARIIKPMEWRIEERWSFYRDWFGIKHRTRNIHGYCSTGQILQFKMVLYRYSLGLVLNTLLSFNLVILIASTSKATY